MVREEGKIAVDFFALWGKKRGGWTSTKESMSKSMNF